MAATEKKPVVVTDLGVLNKPASDLLTWVDARFPLMENWNAHLAQYYAPKNFNFWYYFGGFAMLVLVIQIVTGIFLTMHYKPDAAQAFASVEYIMREVSWGWLVRYMHSTGASMFFLVVYLHMFRAMLYGSYQKPRELLWIFGMLIYLVLMGEAFFGYLLPWGQMSFWGATVITNLFSAIPVIGNHIATWLWGDFAVGDATLNRFFSLHYLLPFIIAGVVGLHIWALHVPGNNNPLGIDVKSPQDTLPFHPYYTVKDAFYLVLFVILFAGFVFYSPDFFGNPDNYQPANPLVTPPDIVPEWYLLPFYAMLRSIPNKLLGVIVMGGAIVTLVFIPWLDTSRVRSCRFRPLMKQFFWAFAVCCVLLGYCGAQAVDAARFGIPLVWVARIASLYYFAFFWLIMPIIGLIETPKKLPASIAQSVFGDNAATPAE